MLEGKEVEGKLGEYGEYSVDLDDKGNVEIAIAAKYKVNLVEVAKAAAAKTKTPVDDNAIAWLEKIMKAGA